MIHDIWLVCENDDTVEPITEPPERMLHLQVVAGVAMMSVHKIDDANLPVPVADVDLFAVSAESLIRALQIFRIDEESPQPVSWRRQSAARSEVDADDEGDVPSGARFTHAQGYPSC